MRRPVHALALLLLVPLHSVWAMPVIRAPDVSIPAGGHSTLSAPLTGEEASRSSIGLVTSRLGARGLYEPVLGDGVLAGNDASLTGSGAGVGSFGGGLEPGVLNTTAAILNDLPPIVIIIIGPLPPPSASEPTTLPLLLAGGLLGLGALRRGVGSP